MSSEYAAEVERAVKSLKDIGLRNCIAHHVAGPMTMDAIYDSVLKCGSYSNKPERAKLEIILDNNMAVDNIVKRNDNLYALTAVGVEAVKKADEEGFHSHSPFQSNYGL